jgi:DNA-binding IclR family transcriptional regulator
LDLEESGQGISCIAVPIFNQKNKIKAAIGVSIPSQRYSAKLKDFALLQMQEAALKISLEIGYKK